MAFTIKHGFSIQSINKYINDKSGQIESAIISRLKYVGETFVKNARNNGNYKDVTGNLRSSIGYILGKNGVILSENFERSGHIQTTIKSGKNKGKIRLTKAKTDEGLNKGRELAQEILDEHSRGVVLICVAGMSYAAAVESLGYDVITNSSITAKNDLISAMKTLNNKIKKL